MKPGAQGPLVVLADVLGFLALSLLALQIVVSGRWAITTSSFGLRSVLSLHRWAGMLVLELVVMHVVLLMLDDPTRLELLDPTTAPNRARAGVLALLGLLAITFASIWRRRLRLSYERWRAIHLVCTTVVIAAAFAHIVWVSAYTSLPTVRRAVLAVVVAAAVALFWTRFARRFATAVRPYRILAVTKERGNAVTVELAAKGHGGLRFEPGQFAWLRAGHCLYGMNDHPFTLSSSANRPDRPTFTVKALGDFSASLADLRAGTDVLVDGPHGESVHQTAGPRGRLLLAAGIGITPAISVLRTAVERREQRPIILLYGSRRWEDVTFREELDQLDQLLPNLEVVHVLSQPDPDWDGEHGRIGEELIARHVPPNVARWSALLCGPSAMVDQATSTLLIWDWKEQMAQLDGDGQHDDHLVMPLASHLSAYVGAQADRLLADDPVLTAVPSRAPLISEAFHVAADKGWYALKLTHSGSKVCKWYQHSTTEAERLSRTPDDWQIASGAVVSGVLSCSSMTSSSPEHLYSLTPSRFKPRARPGCEPSLSDDTSPIIIATTTTLFALSAANTRSTGLPALERLRRKFDLAMGYARRATSI